jgi:hypothetical protein
VSRLARSARLSRRARDDRRARSLATKREHLLTARADELIKNLPQRPSGARPGRARVHTSQSAGQETSSAAAVCTGGRRASDLNYCLLALIVRPARRSRPSIEPPVRAAATLLCNIECAHHRPRMTHVETLVDSHAHKRAHTTTRTASSGCACCWRRQPPALSPLQQTSNLHVQP